MSADDSILNAKDDTGGAGSGGEGGAQASGQAQGEQAQQQAAGAGAQEQGQEKQSGGDADDSILGKDPEEGESEGDKKDGEGEGEKKDGDKADAITPESYGDFTTPEGMPVNETILGEFKTVAAELKLPKEAAQKLVDLQVKNVQAQMEQWKHTRQTWVAELKADKEYGGDNFNKTIHKANMALRQFDKDGGFLKALKGTFENHPETVKFLARVHDALGEDAVHTGRDAGKGKEIPLAQQLWSAKDMPAGVKI